MRQDEAIRLAYALAAKAAELTGVRVLAIKGIVASHHGLRTAHTPADIDVLIEPDGFTAFTRQLEGWGWRVRVGEFSDLPAPHHSLTYINDTWPCDIDAHHRFPGFLAAPERTFDALWERRQLATVAGRLIPIADWSGSVAIMSLHSIRSAGDDPAQARDLNDLAALSSSWTLEQRRDLSDLARATGCVQSLGAIWERLDVPVDPTNEDISVDDLAEWQRKLDGRVPSIRVWLRYLGEGEPRQILARARVMLWPPEVMMRASRPIPEGDLPLLRARVARITKALWKAPASLVAIARGGDSVAGDAWTDPKR